MEQSLLPRLMLPRVEAAVGVDMAVAGVVVVTVVADSAVDMVAGLAVGTLVALAVAASVAVALESVFFPERGRRLLERQT